MKKLILLSVFCILTRAISAQACYTATQITYTPDSFNVGTIIPIGDDQYSDTINLPFQFCFYGTTYSQLVVGANGVICFDISNAGAFCQWPITNAVPSSMSPLNSIYFPYQDIYWDSTYRFYCNTYGIFPNRKFVVSIYHSPMYGCITTKSFTGEVMLFETSNVIEMHIQRKELCSSWNGGYAIMGMQNATGTAATVVPGRNFPMQWTANNEAWRFTSNCCNVGIQSEFSPADIIVFPNPASNEVHLSYQNGKSENFSVELMDISGRIIYHDDFSAKMERVIQPNVSAGIYLVRLIGENGVILAERKLALQ